MRCAHPLPQLPSPVPVSHRGHRQEGPHQETLPLPGHHDAVREAQVPAGRGAVPQAPASPSPPSKTRPAPRATSTPRSPSSWLVPDSSNSSTGSPIPTGAGAPEPQTAQPDAIHRTPPSAQAGTQRPQPPRHRSGRYPRRQTVQNVQNRLPPQNYPETDPTRLSMTVPFTLISGLESTLRFPVYGTSKQACRCIWEFRTGRPPHPLEGHTGPPTARRRTMAAVRSSRAMPAVLAQSSGTPGPRRSSERGRRIGRPPRNLRAPVAGCSAPGRTPGGGTPRSAEAGAASGEVVVDAPAAEPRLLVMEHQEEHRLALLLTHGTAVPRHLNPGVRLPPWRQPGTLQHYRTAGPATCRIAGHVMAVYRPRYPLTGPGPLAVRQPKNGARKPSRGNPEHG